MFAAPLLGFGKAAHMAVPAAFGLGSLASQDRLDVLEPFAGKL